MRLAKVITFALLAASISAGEAVERVARVCVDDQRIHVPETAARGAAEIVDELYRDAGIGMAWTHSVAGDQSAGSCDGSEFPIRLTLVRKRPATSHALGATSFRPDGTPSMVVYYEATVEDARTRHVSVTTLLGYVIAHEIAHAMLGTEHDARGIMRAQWTEAEFCRMTSRHLRFGSEQQRILHAAARARGVPPPLDLMAGVK